MSPQVTVYGGGLAGLTCALLLARGGYRVTIVGAAQDGGPPYLVLNEPTVAILTHVWADPEATLLTGSHRLTGRRIQWGPGAETHTVPAPAVVIDRAGLLSALEQRLFQLTPHQVVRAEPADVPEPGQGSGQGSGHWTIEASAAAVTDRGPAVGRRCALVAQVPLSGEAQRTESWMTTAPDSWLYLAPINNRHALIQAMTPEPPPDPVEHLTALLAASPQHRWLAESPHQVAVVPAAPWLASAYCGPGRLQIGGAAVRFDPVSGSGAGHALRSALLAAAVIRGIDDGLPEDAALAHYTQRLRAAFHDHLSSCASHYRAAFDSPGWRAELNATQAALALGAQQLNGHHFEFALHGDKLVSLP
jgi:flavin-dependent dehydrogenase